MKNSTLENLLEQAQKGNMAVREELIRYHKSFIAKVSSKICKRYLTWENDDELSVALLAFNEAIDCYNRGSGANFYTFAQKVISRKLMNFFRKESRHRNISLSPKDPDEELSDVDKKSSFQKYKQSRHEESFAEVVKSFNETLKEFQISLADLVKVSPKHRDTKEALVNAAQRLVDDAGLLEHLYRYKQLPLKELMEATGLSRKVLEKGRKYVIATTLIISSPEFSSLKHFAQFAFENKK